MHFGCINVLKMGFDPARMGVCDQNLSVTRSPDQFNQTLSALLIDFFKISSKSKMGWLFVTLWK